MTEEQESTYSIVEYLNDHSGYRCGYCKAKDSNYSHGMWAHRMSVLDYQALINRGWRRSGCYCYKPTMDKTCCPHYTVKCDPLNFKLSKSQKKVLKRMHNFLSHGKSIKDTIDEERQQYGNLTEENKLSEHHSKLEIDKDLSTLQIPKNLESKDCLKANEEVLDVLPTTDLSYNFQLQDSNRPRCQSQNISIKKKILKSTFVSQGSGPDPSKPPCKKAKFLRKEKLLAKASSTIAMNECSKVKNVPKSLEDFINEPLPEKPAHRLEVKLVQSSPPNAEFNDTFDISHTVYEKYQTIIHCDPKEKCVKSKYKRFLVKSPLQLRLVRGTPNTGTLKTTFKDSYGVFRNYQMTIHNEPESECEESSFINFLVDSPLVHWKPSSGPPSGYGSFHQQYWLDDELIAVGVIDILPNCLSSVYLYYNPKYSFLSLGTYSSLREIALVKELHKTVPNLKWYYMGYYIHSCPKMRYKGKFLPSYLLCPEKYTWEPIERCIPKLEMSKYSKLAEDDGNFADENIDVNKVLCLYRGTVMQYSKYRHLSAGLSQGIPTSEEEVKKYASLTGSTLAYSMLLYRK